MHRLSRLNLTLLLCEGYSFVGLVLKGLMFVGEDQNIWFYLNNLFVIYIIVQSFMQHLTLNQLNIIKQIFWNIYPALKNKNFVCAGQLIITTPIQPVKLPTTTVTRLPSPFDENEFERCNLEFWWLKKMKTLQIGL